MQTTRLPTAQRGDTGLEIDPVIPAAHLELSDTDVATIERRA
jgi:hypothetical protein